MDLVRPVPNWQLWRGEMQRSQRSETEKTAGLWALDVLASMLGSDWPERTFESEGSVPSEVLGAATHVLYFAQLLDLALRLELLRGVTGIQTVVRDLRQDLRFDRRAHSAIQLEVAGLAARAGFDVALERRISPGGGPVDVLLEKVGVVIAVEARVILRDQESREATSFWDRLMEGLMVVSFRHGVEFSGEVISRLGDEALVEWFANLDSAASQVASDSVSRTVPTAAGTITVLAPRDAGEARLTGPRESTDGWPRIRSALRDKAQQAATAGATWLRLDVMDGLWQLTPWSAWPLAQKAKVLAQAVREDMTSATLLGAVVTSGACLSWGGHENASFRDPAELTFALCRVLPLGRVRECVIVGLSNEALEGMQLWYQLYDDEPNWLDWAVAKVSLPRLRPL
jgi:hypothetical protein